MSGIGILGAGTAGLHLALLLQQQGVETTLYAERTADELRTGRLPNTVGHHAHTRARERLLGVNHWDGSGLDIRGHAHWFGGEQPLEFPGWLTEPGLAVDYRLYLAQLLEDYDARGGDVRYGPIEAADLEGLRHELVVVATGRGGFADVFPRIPDRSPFVTPARLLSAGIYAGVAQSDPVTVSYNLSPPHGEVVGIPIVTFEGPAMAILFECVPGGELEAVARTPYGDDPAAYEQLVLEAVRVHAPPLHARVDAASFGLTSPSSILQGAVTPTVRASFARLGDGRVAIALGDAHVVPDPIVGQGANAASYAAFALGETILEGGPYDEAFVRRVDERRLPFVLGVFDWSNFMLAPEPYLFPLVGAMAENQALVNDFADNFNHPDVMWERLSSAEAVAAYIESFTMTGRELSV